MCDVISFEHCIHGMADTLMRMGHPDFLPELMLRTMLTNNHGQQPVHKLLSYASIMPVIPEIEIVLYGFLVISGNLGAH